MPPSPIIHQQLRDDAASSPLGPYDIVMLVLGILPVLALLYTCMLWLGARVAVLYDVWTRSVQSLIILRLHL